MTTTQLPLLPQSLPKTQADWQFVVNVLQTWAGAIQQLETLTTTNSGAGFDTSINGTVTQYGSLVATNGVTTTVTFPTAFPTGVTSVQCTLFSPFSTTNTVFVVGGSVTTTQFQLFVGGGGVGSSGVYWEAIGT